MQAHREGAINFGEKIQVGFVLKKRSSEAVSDCMLVLIIDVRGEGA